MALMKFKSVVLKNLFSKPVTKNYPAEPAVYPERSRGHVEINIDDCILCGICGMSSHFFSALSTVIASFGHFLAQSVQNTHVSISAAGIFFTVIGFS